jgi:hypothetical protein
MEHLTGVPTMTTFTASHASIDALAIRGANAMMEAAADYCRVHHLLADVDVLLASIRRVSAVRSGEALADAKEAFDCNMAQIAVATFLASMRLAGIEAAKACGFPAK